MAVYFQNTLVRTSDYVKISGRYASVQGVWRAKKQGKLTLKTIGGLQFATLPAEAVSALYSLPNWQGLSVVSPEQIPHGLATLNSIGKQTGASESVIIQWALFNRLDVYWVGGTFFANPVVAKQVLAANPK